MEAILAICSFARVVWLSDNTYRRIEASSRPQSWPVHGWTYVEKFSYLTWSRFPAACASQPDSRGCHAMMPTVRCLTWQPWAKRG